MEARYEPRRESFAAWLVKQDRSPEWYSQLALQAKADRALPRDADPTTVHRRLQILGADGDAFEQLEDAERAWAAAA